MTSSGRLAPALQQYVLLHCKQQPDGMQASAAAVVPVNNCREGNTTPQSPTVQCDQQPHKHSLEPNITWCCPCCSHAAFASQGIDAAPMGETKPTRVVLKETWVLMKEKSKSYAKGFAGMGFLYSGTECMIERYRAKHDAMNATLAGCATGGLMAAPGRVCVAVDRHLHPVNMMYRPHGVVCRCLFRGIDCATSQPRCDHMARQE